MKIVFYLTQRLPAENPALSIGLISNKKLCVFK